MELERLERAVSLLGSREPGDALLRTFLSYASQDSGADMSALYLLTPPPGSLGRAVTIDVPPRWRRGLESALLGDGACGRAVSRNGPVVIPDLAGARGGFAGGLGERMGIRALYATPVPSSDGSPLGAIAQLFRAPHRPSKEELILSGLYSRLVATVIERVRLRDQLDVREALAEQRRSELVNAAGLVLEASLDPSTLLADVARAALPSLGDLCIVNLRDARGLARGATAHLDEAAAATLRARVPVGARASAREAASVEGRRAELVPAEGARILAPQLRAELGVGSFLLVPLIVGSQPIGGLTFGARRELTEVDLRTAEAYARRAVLAIENMRSHEAAQRAVSARDELLAIVAHDLRNLVATVGMSATLLARCSGADDVRGRKQIDIIARTTARMKHLVNDLLDGARLESGRFAVNPAPCTVGGLLRAAVEIGQPLADERGLRLVCRAPAEEIALRCDEARIVQVLTNLLGNALKFTPRGTITLRARLKGDAVRFQVTDQGVGIAPDELPHVFDRYWTVDGQHGTGLGLHIAKSIVEAHGGQLRVKSAPGRGSTFWFTIPLTAV